MRITCSSGVTKTFPSPTLPVAAAETMASVICSTLSSEQAISIFVDFSFQRDLEQDGHAYAVQQMSGLLAQIAGAILTSLDTLTP